MANNNYDAAAYGADRTIIALAAVMYNIHQKEMAQMERMQTQHTVDMYRLRGVPEARIQQALDERDDYQSALYWADTYAKIVRGHPWIRFLETILVFIGAGILIGINISLMVAPTLLSAKSDLVLIGLITLFVYVVHRRNITRDAKIAEAKAKLPELSTFIADARKRGVPSLYIP